MKVVPQEALTSCPLTGKGFFILLLFTLDPKPLLEAS